MITEPRTVPLSTFQQRDVQALLDQSKTIETQANEALAKIQQQLNTIARIVIGHEFDPDETAGCHIDVMNPSVGIVITPKPVPTES